MKRVKTKVKRLAKPQPKSPAAFALKNSPKEVCEAMIDAAKKKDLKTIQLWSLRSNLLSTHLQMAGRAARVGESRQASERGQVLSRAALAMIQELSCGSEHRAGNRPVVEAETKDQKRLIPFVQKDGKSMFELIKASTAMTWRH